MKNYLCVVSLLFTLSQVALAQNDEDPNLSNGTIVQCTTLDKKYNITVIDRGPGENDRFELTIRQNGNPSPVLYKGDSAVYASKPFADPKAEIYAVVGGGIQLERTSNTPGLSMIKKNSYYDSGKEWNEYAKCKWYPFVQE